MLEPSAAAIPASDVSASTGSERASTSSRDSSRSATNTERGESSTPGTRSHHSRSAIHAPSVVPLSYVRAVDEELTGALRGGNAVRGHARDRDAGRLAEEVRGRIAWEERLTTAAGSSTAAS